MERCMDELGAIEWVHRYSDRCARVWVDEDERLNEDVGNGCMGRWRSHNGWPDVRVISYTSMQIHSE